jgi:cytochrome c-type biogenesis protein CcmH/NrfG
MFASPQYSNACVPQDHDLIEQYQQKLQKDPRDIGALINLGAIFFRQKNYDRALNYFRRVIEIAPAVASAYFNCGLALDAQGKADQAYEQYVKTIERDAKHARARMKIINYLQSKEKHEEAMEHCNILMHSEPTNREYRQKKAQIYFGQNNIDKALINYRKALLLDGKEAQLLLEYANALNLCNSTECAFEMYKAINEAGTFSTNIAYNLAYTLKKMGEYARTIEICNDIIKEVPNYAQAHFTLATSYLTLGDFSKGWQEYEWRWKHGDTSERVFKEPRWDGSDLTGKTIYLHAEQGLGDTFQFIRFAKIAKERGGYVIAGVQKPLITIIAQCPYIDKVIQYGTAPGRFDSQAALMSMPYILNTQEDTIPNMHPYLFADEDLVAHWHDQLKEDKNFKVGLCWQGNPNYHTQFLRMIVAGKSMRPATFAPLSAIKGVSFYSLQKFHANNVDESLPEEFRINTFDDSFDNGHGRFMDTAALMKNLDLIITVDTATAHLAGGLGVPVWTVLPKFADWRWLLDRSDTPWYPTMRLFRQTVADDWTTVIDDLFQALEPLVRAHQERHEANSTTCYSRQS